MFAEEREEEQVEYLQDFPRLHGGSFRVERHPNSNQPEAGGRHKRFVALLLRAVLGEGSCERSGGDACLTAGFLLVARAAPRDGGVG